MSARPLFGGMMSCIIPPGFDDVSPFRQVPDNQEVFSNAETDQCLIIELLEFEQTVTNAGSAHYFFQEIAKANHCGPGDIKESNATVLGPEDGPTIDAEHITSIIIGDQRVSKFKEGEEAKNTIRVYLANIRLPTVSTDIVLTLSSPVHINPKSSSSDSKPQAHTSATSAGIFQEALKSLQILDWSLFNAEVGCED